MNVYETIPLFKKRANSKKWERKEAVYSDRPIFIEESAKSDWTAYEYHDAESIDQVVAFNQDVNLIVMAPFGQNLKTKPLHFPTLLKDAESCTQRCSVTGKKVVIAHYYKGN